MGRSKGNEGSRRVKSDVLKNFCLVAASDSKDCVTWKVSKMKNALLDDSARVDDNSNDQGN